MTHLHCSYQCEDHRQDSQGRIYHDIDAVAELVTTASMFVEIWCCVRAACRLRLAAYNLCRWSKRSLGTPRICLFVRYINLRAGGEALKIYPTIGRKRCGAQNIAVIHLVWMQFRTSCGSHIQIGPDPVLRLRLILACKMG